ncbi:MAG: NosD domain-containing protein, partial [Candidatus Micrarchaeia archaeon]
MKVIFPNVSLYKSSSKIINAINMNTKINSSLLLLYIIFFYSLIPFVFAGNCGGSTPCNCGDTIIQDYVMTSDLICPYDGLIILTNNITLDCSGHTIVYGGGSNSEGVTINTYSNITIKNCIIIANSSGSNNIGISFAGSYNNLVYNCTIKDNPYGIVLELSQASIINNNISNNNYGIIIQFSSFNNHLSNNFFNNTNNFLLYGNATWNTTLDCLSGPNIVGGPCIGGNFYATPSGTGFSETCTDNDGNGICDSNYTLATNNIDFLPLSVPPIPPIELTTCGTLDQEGKTYVLTQDISSSATCFTIDTDHITLDCQGYTITHTGSGYGVYADGRTNITIKNCNIIGNSLSSYGVYFISTNKSILSNITVSNSSIGIYLKYSSNNYLVKLNTSNNYPGNGIYLEYSSNNNISNSIALNNSQGINLFIGSNNSFSDIISSYNSVDGISLYSGSNNSISNITTSSNGRGLVLNSVSNTLIFNVTSFDNSLKGIWLYGAQNTTFINSTIYDNTYNLFLEGYEETQNIDTSNLVDGKPVYWIKDATNTVYDSSTNAGLFACFNCNNITVKDLVLSKNSHGILLKGTTNSFISNITASSNYFGIYLEDSSNNSLSNNTANSNENGIYLDSSSNNFIYNNFFNNTNNVVFDGNIYENFWNTTLNCTPGSSQNIIGGDCIGGNFWADPSGTGFSETCTDNDGNGICDEAYELATNNIDFLPLAVYT